MKKREKVFRKFNGRCAYCGKDLKQFKTWSVDHVHPKYLGGSDELDNLYPACVRCNRVKATYSIEEFRLEIEKQHERLLKYNSFYNICVELQKIVYNPCRVVFYFETINAGVARS